MRGYLRESMLGGGVAVVTAVGLCLLGASPWGAHPAVLSIPVFAAVALIMGLTAALDLPGVSERRETLRLGFIGELTVLLFYGPLAMTLAAAAAALACGLIGSRPRATDLRRAGADLAVAVGSALVSGYAYATLSTAPPLLAWPARAIPLGVAVVAYAVTTHVAGQLLQALATGASPGRRWLREAFSLVPAHVIGAAVSVLFAEALARGAWDVLPAAAVPLYFGWLAFRRNDHAIRDRLAASPPETGLAALDDEGRLVAWNEAISRMLECPADRAMGRTLADAAPALSESGATVVVNDALRKRTLRILPEVVFRTPAGRARVLTITAVPDAGTLLWLEVTDAAPDEGSPRQVVERFALIARGANDGLWELNTRTQSVYVSPRWRDIVGLPAGGDHVTRAEWFDRVHRDDVGSLLQTVDAHVAGRTERLEHEHRVRHEDGGYRRVLCRGVGARDARGRIARIAGSLTDITESALAREQILSAGLRDPLTGLLNRGAFVEALGLRLDEYRSRRGGPFAALFLDIDRFKIVNDSLGHMVGDDLLVAVARRLENCIRPGDSIARVGGDEFAILLRGLADAMQANVVAFRIQEALCQPFAFDGRDVVTSASIGIAFSRPEYGNPEEIMRDADTAMYHAKTHGKARHELFDADMHARVTDRLDLESDLRQAVKTSAFEMNYQPIVSLGSRMCIGFEALVRWKRNGKPVSPADFIPMAEELGLIEPLGTWVLEQSCRSFVEWQRRFPAAGLECITVNVSTRQLMQQGFLYLVEQMVEQTGISPHNLRLEITETAIMDAPRAAAEVLRELRAIGVRIYLDDFGTGYSSLSHLHRLPVDALKIDQSFVRELLVDDRPAIVESILALARTLHTSVVAEGVEDERQAHELRRLGCLYAQGYLFSRPLAAENVEALLATPRPLGGAPPSVRPDLAAVRA